MSSGVTSGIKNLWWKIFEGKIPHKGPQGAVNSMTIYPYQSDKMKPKEDDNGR